MLDRWGEYLEPTDLVDDATAELERIETVLDYHLFIVEDARAAEERDESARTGLGHGVRLVQQLADKLARAIDRIHRWFIGASSAAMDDALAPLRAHRPEEVVQGLAVREASKTPSWWQSRARALRSGLGQAYQTAAVQAVHDLYQRQLATPDQVGADVRDRNRTYRQLSGWAGLDELYDIERRTTEPGT